MSKAHKWIDFEKFLSRHGEIGTQAILENLERFEGIRHSAPVTLEERWHILMSATPSQQNFAVA